MSSSTFKNLVATVLLSGVTVVESRNLGKGDESEVMQLRQENSRLNQTLMDLRQNYSRFVIQRQNEQANAVGNEDKIEYLYVKDRDHCVQSVIRLVEESIRVYDGFLKNELREAESNLCRPGCGGRGEGTCECCSDYREPLCEVGEYVKVNIVGPFLQRADQLRNRTNIMIDALQKGLKTHFGAVISFSGESRK